MGNKQVMNTKDVSGKMHELLSTYNIAKMLIKTSKNEIITDVVLKDDTIIIVTEKENTPPVEFEVYTPPAYKATCNWCESKISFYDGAMITKPSKRYPLALMMIYVKCPECGRLVLLGNYPKRSDDKGNYEAKTKPKDWELDVIEDYRRE